MVGKYTELINWCFYCNMHFDSLSDAIVIAIVLRSIKKILMQHKDRIDAYHTNLLLEACTLVCKIIWNIVITTG